MDESQFSLHACVWKWGKMPISWHGHCVQLTLDWTIKLRVPLKYSGTKPEKCIHIIFHILSINIPTIYIYIPLYSQWMEYYYSNYGIYWEYSWYQTYMPIIAISIYINAVPMPRRWPRPRRPSDATFAVAAQHCGVLETLLAFREGRLVWVSIRGRD